MNTAAWIVIVCWATAAAGALALWLAESPTRVARHCRNALNMPATTQEEDQ